MVLCQNDTWYKTPRLDMIYLPQCSGQDGTLGVYVANCFHKPHPPSTKTIVQIEQEIAKAKQCTSNKSCVLSSLVENIAVPLPYIYFCTN